MSSPAKYILQFKQQSVQKNNKIFFAIDFNPESMKHHLSSYERQKIKEVYRSFDEDGDGRVTRSELILAANNYLDKTLPSGDDRSRLRIISVIEETVKVIDSDGNGV